MRSRDHPPLTQSLIPIFGANSALSVPHPSQLGFRNFLDCHQITSRPHSPAQPASVTLLPNNWRGHLRWPMTSLVVHFCSAPLVCFVDALDRHAFPAGHRQQGRSHLPGLLHCLPAGLLCRRGRPLQRVAKRFPCAASILDDHAFLLGLLFIGRIKGSQELALCLVEVSVGGTAGDLLQFRAEGARSGRTPQRRRGMRCLLESDGLAVVLDDQLAVGPFQGLHPETGIAGPSAPGSSCSNRQWYFTVLSRATLRVCLMQTVSVRDISADTGR